MKQSAGETKRALFQAAMAAQVAEEPHVNAHRIVAALLRSPAVGEFCVRGGIDVEQAFKAADDEQSLPFDACQSRLESDLAASGLEPWTKEHRATFQERPLDPILEPVFDSVLRLPGQFAVSPLSLLRTVLATHSLIAARLAPFGLTLEKLDADLDEEKL